MEDFDSEIAFLKGPDLFSRFRVLNKPSLLSKSDLDNNENILIVERSKSRQAFVVREMAYHHLAQGELAGEPHAVSF